MCSVGRAQEIISPHQLQYPVPWNQVVVILRLLTVQRAQEGGYYICFTSST